MRILVIEDEQAIGHQLCQSLQQQDYVVDYAADGEEGLYYALEYDYDAAVIDLGLPKLDGVSLIRQLRQQRHYPVLILTARDHWQDKVEALEAGADDYLTKPFHYPELLARLHALIRRSAGSGSNRLQQGPLTLDLLSRQVWLKDKEIRLTAYEYKVLEYLVRHRHQTVSRQQLTDHIYAQDYERDSNVIEVFIRRLRHKLAVDGLPCPIETRRGMGYRFVW